MSFGENLKALSTARLNRCVRRPTNTTLDEARNFSGTMGVGKEAQLAELLMCHKHETEE
jgi:hypothetical protein